MFRRPRPDMVTEVTESDDGRDEVMRDAVEWRAGFPF
jgi:hypothetical protein